MIRRRHPDPEESGFLYKPSRNCIPKRRKDVITEKIRRVYGKLFVGGEWKVAYRERSNAEAEYNVIEAPENTWIADPLLFEENGQHYLFVELFNRKLDKAGIGCYRFDDGKPVFLKQVIEQPFHLSYPCVFTWQGEHYMIPESAAGRTLDLYRAERFPDTWTMERHLLQDIRIVDTTVVQRNGELYALGYRKEGRQWALSVYRLDMNRKELTQTAEEVFPVNTGRPAGYILQDEWLRPAQDCSSVYGESVIWYQIDEMEGPVYREHPVKKMKVSDLPFSGKADRVHTYSRDSRYEAVDLRVGRFDLFHGIKTLRRALNGAKAASNQSEG